MNSKIPSRPLSSNGIAIAQRLPLCPVSASPVLKPSQSLDRLWMNQDSALVLDDIVCPFPRKVSPSAQKDQQDEEEELLDQLALTRLK